MLSPPSTITITELRGHRRTHCGELRMGKMLHRLGGGKTSSMAVIPAIRTPAVAGGLGALHFGLRPGPGALHFGVRASCPRFHSMFLSSVPDAPCENPQDSRGQLHRCRARQCNHSGREVTVEVDYGPITVRGLLVAKRTPGFAMRSETVISGG